MQQQQPQQPVPQAVLIGQVNKKCEKFNDESELTKQGGCTKINAIKVYYNDKHVIGIALYYKLADGDFLKASHNVPKDRKGIEKRVLEIGPDDYLLEISGHKSDVINRLSFVTYRGKIMTMGSDLGEPFLHKFQGYTFGPFRGGHRNALEYLDIPIIPVNAEFLAQFKPVQVNVNVGQQNNQAKPAYSGLYVKPTTNSGFMQVKMPASAPINPVAPTMNHQPQFQQQQQQQFQPAQQQQFQPKYPKF